MRNFSIVPQCRAGHRTRQAITGRRPGVAIGRAYNRAVGANELRDLLNRVRWDRAAGGAGVVVEIRERSEGGEGVRAVSFAALVEILARGVTLADGTFIPYHRVLAVRRYDEVVWRAGGRDHGEA
jgi:uncharacterized protein (UPF0248 family)